MEHKDWQLINQKVFDDTQAYCFENRDLAMAVLHAREDTELFMADDNSPIEASQEKAGIVTVTKERSFEAARRLSQKYPGKKIAVLNFASAVTPGGGVLRGSSAQEESLCRTSTLHPVLCRPLLYRLYYSPNMARGNRLNTDDCIYTPGIIICKTDEDEPKRLPAEDWVTVDVITCAAPDLRRGQYLSDEELSGLHERRARQILHVAGLHQADVLLLGAFGCGAFGNDPYLVAKVYASVLKETRRYFEEVCFPVFCRDIENENHKAFAELLHDLT